MKRAGQVKEITFSNLDSKPLRRLPLFVNKVLPHLNTPFKIEINGNWSIAHNCLSCNSNVILQVTEPIISNQENFTLHKPLSTKYYSKNELDEICDLFDNTELRIRNKDQVSLIVLKTTADSNVWLIPLNIFSYKCKKCDLTYWVLYERSYGGGYEKGEIAIPDYIYFYSIVGLI